ncbi:MAG: histidinol-phosphate transaminase [Aeromicrobium sp.]|nr:histidinol-phosphate transaminase [Burkholderiales bacterium]
MNFADLAPDYIRAISPYQGGKPISDVARELGIPESEILKLASNENPLGASPKALVAIRSAIDQLALYPDGGGVAFKAAVTKKFSVPANQIILGNGSNDVLELAARTFMGAGDTAVYSQYAFAVYPLATQAVGARPIAVDALNFGNDLAAMLDAIQPSTKIVFVANPNNPTGTFISAAALKAFVAKVPANVLVILDEAYGEYLEDVDAYDSSQWLAEFPNLLVSHTLSKAYGLAGLRIGFGFAAPDVVAMMNRVRQPFNVNHLAMVAAEAALTDDEFIGASRRQNSQALTALSSAFTSRGIEFIPSKGNFIAFKIARAGDVFQCLLKAGVIVRPIANYGLADYLRVSTGTAAQNARFLAALDDARQTLKV